MYHVVWEVEETRGASCKSRLVLSSEGLLPVQQKGKDRNIPKRRKHVWEEHGVIEVVNSVPAPPSVKVSMLSTLKTEADSLPMP